jgi:hypothetical protein
MAPQHNLQEERKIKEAHAAEGKHMSKRSKRAPTARPQNGIRSKGPAARKIRRESTMPDGAVSISLPANLSEPLRQLALASAYFLDLLVLLEKKTPETAPQGENTFELFKTCLADMDAKIAKWVHRKYPTWQSFVIGRANQATARSLREAMAAMSRANPALSTTVMKIEDLSNEELASLSRDLGTTESSLESSEDSLEKPAS